jgi:hypothetical protein
VPVGERERTRGCARAHAKRKRDPLEEPQVERQRHRVVGAEARGHPEARDRDADRGACAMLLPQRAMLAALGG